MVLLQLLLQLLVLHDTEDKLGEARESPLSMIVDPPVSQRGRDLSSRGGGGAVSGCGRRGGEQGAI